MADLLPLYDKLQAACAAGDKQAIAFAEMDLANAGVQAPLGADPCSLIANLGPAYTPPVDVPGTGPGPGPGTTPGAPPGTGSSRTYLPGQLRTVPASRPIVRTGAPDRSSSGFGLWWTVGAVAGLALSYAVFGRK